MVLRQSNVIPMNLPSGLSISQQTSKARVPRKPSHTFLINQKPYELTPFFIAPVLAGETMKNLLLQARVVSSAVKNPLIGHHIEHYFFYVKLRDMVDSGDIVEMLMDTTAGSGVNRASAGDAMMYVSQGACDWFKMATDAVLKAWFRDEGDNTSHVGATTGLPMVQWSNHKSLFESLVVDSDLETANLIEQPFPEHEQAYNQWLFMRQNQLTEMTYEDYLGTFGVRLTKAEEGKPELLRFTKNWSYPSNTVDAEGAINSQLSWSIQERADKDRFFKEPGFVVGYTVARPKVYLANQKQAAVSVLDSALSWLPATMKENAYSSLKRILGTDTATSPIVTGDTPSNSVWDETEPLWVDVRDLFVYGDQFTNLPQNSDNFAVPPEDINTFFGKKYPSSAALQLIGKDDKLDYKSDGIVSLNVLGTQIDMT